jgi:putative colanic acid biosynthesis acetyltransferase WcaF
VRLNLREFTGKGYDKGRPLLVQIAWAAICEPILRKVWVPTGVRVAVLRAFGATIGSGVLIRHDVRIHWPWKLTVGDDCWIGVDAWLLNLEPISIGSNVCISQGALLCTGSHNARTPSFEFDNAPIVIGDEVWIAARATVLRGVTIGPRSVVGAAALVTKDCPPDSTTLAPRATSQERSQPA